MSARAASGTIVAFADDDLCKRHLAERVPKKTPRCVGTWKAEAALSGRLRFLALRNEVGMPPGANWKGYLKLSLVTCSVELFPATSVEVKKIEYDRVALRPDLKAFLKRREIGGHDVKLLPLLQRKEILEQLFSAAPPGGPLRYSAHFASGGEELAPSLPARRRGIGA